MSAYVDAFDLDHTLITANASFRFGTYLFRKKAFNLLTMLMLASYYTRYKFFGMTVKDLHLKSFHRLFQGRLKKQVDAQVESFLDENLDKLFYGPAIDRLRTAQKEHHVTAIFSSSPDFLVGPIAARLGVKHWGASRYAVDNFGVYETVAGVLEGEEKATMLGALVKDLGVGLDAATVYSDSLLDLPFLQAGGRAVAVNPDKRLRALSQEQGWEVI